MKKGYTVTLSSRYTEDVEIETEEEDETKIMETAAMDFVDSMRGSNDIEDIFGDIQAVNIKRNYSEKPESLLTAKERLKDYMVGFSGRSTYLTVTVGATSEKEAIDNAEDEITLQFTSEDEKTDCEVRHYSFDSIEEMKFEKET